MELLVEFHTRENRFPKAYEVYKDVKLGQFFVSLRHGMTQVTDEMRTILTKLDTNWDKQLRSKRS